MQKIKQFIKSNKGQDFLIVIIVILVGLGSFELGRLSKVDNSSGIKIQNTPESEEINQDANQPANVISATNLNTLNNSTKNFFASSKGSKYYPVGCTAGKTIKQENRVYFETREKAEQAGYNLSTSCK